MMVGFGLVGWLVCSCLRLKKCELWMMLGMLEREKWLRMMMIFWIWKMMRMMRLLFVMFWLVGRIGMMGYGYGIVIRWCFFNIFLWLIFDLFLIVENVYICFILFIFYIIGCFVCIFWVIFLMVSFFYFILWWRILLEIIRIKLLCLRIFFFLFIKLRWLVFICVSMCLLWRYFLIELMWFLSCVEKSKRW